MVLYCKSADSQQTEGQTPATLIWFGLFKQLNEWQSRNVSGEVQRAVMRIYWKEARKSPYSVARAFLGGGKESNYVQMCPENLPTCSYLLDPVTFIVYLNSLGKALDFSPCDAITTQNDLMS